MLHLSLTTAAVALLCTGTIAQSDMQSLMQPITAPIKHAGIYHVASDTWTRGASLAEMGTFTIYNNTCAPFFFTGMLSTERFQHRSRIPSLTSPTIPTSTPGRPPTDNDSAPGCSNAYCVTGFQVAYCSSSPSTIDWRYQFASNYQLCGGADMVPEYTIDVPALPGGTGPGQQQCWIVDIDVSGTGGNCFVLAADGDGDYDGAIGVNEFGFSFGPISPTTAADFTGPIIAGDFTWAGDGTTGPLLPCTGTDGTKWDSPPDMLEEGTGMGSLPFFRDTGSTVSGPMGPGCYYFGGNPHADFWLEMYDSALGPICPAPNPMVEFCYPNFGGTRSCRCGNQPVPNNGTRGCNNFGKTPPSSGDPTTATGGAILTATGTAMASTSTTLVFHVSRQHPTPSGNITILLMGSATLSPGVISGAGVRCVGGLLIPRPYKGQSVYDGGSPGACNIDFPNGSLPPPYNQDAWTRSGFPVPGTVRYYYAAYRNTAAGNNHAPCGPSDAFNLTNAGAVTWQ